MGRAAPLLSRLGLEWMRYDWLDFDFFVVRRGFAGF